MDNKNLEQIDYERLSFKNYNSDLKFFIQDMLEDKTLTTDPELVKEIKTKCESLCESISKAVTSLEDSIKKELNLIKFKVGDYIKLPTIGDDASYTTTTIYYIKKITDKGLIIFDVLKVTIGDYNNSISLEEGKHVSIDFGFEDDNITLNNPEDIEFYKKYSSIFK